MEKQKAADRKDEHKAALRRQAAARATAQEAAAQERQPSTQVRPPANRARPLPHGSSQRRVHSASLSVSLSTSCLQKRAALAADGKLKDAKKGWVCMGIPGQVCGELNLLTGRRAVHAEPR